MSEKKTNSVRIAQIFKTFLLKTVFLFLFHLKMCPKKKKLS